MIFDWLDINDCKSELIKKFQEEILELSKQKEKIINVMDERIFKQIEIYDGKLKSFEQDAILNITTTYYGYMV